MRFDGFISILSADNNVYDWHYFYKTRSSELKFLSQYTLMYLSQLMIIIDLILLLTKSYNIIIFKIKIILIQTLINSYTSCVKLIFFHQQMYHVKSLC